MNSSFSANNEISQSTKIENAKNTINSTKAKRPKKKMKWYSIPLILLYILLGMLSIVVITMLILNSLFHGVYVDGESMQPTLQNGDFLYMRKNVTPMRGDIIVIQADINDTPKLVIKRVIGLQGDRLYQENERLMRNRAGSDTSEDCGSIGTWHVNFSAVTVGEGQVFVCGDNRENSLDSRTDSFGLLSLANLKGVITPWSIKHKAQITKITQFFKKNPILNGKKLEEGGYQYGESRYCITT